MWSKKTSRTWDRIQINKDNIQSVTELNFSTRTDLPQENPTTDPGERERVAAGALEICLSENLDMESFEFADLWNIWIIWKHLETVQNIRHWVSFENIWVFENVWTFGNNLQYLTLDFIWEYLNIWKYLNIWGYLKIFDIGFHYIWHCNILN